jgi:hypothetical protein
MKQEWRVKVKTSMPALMASNDNMVLLDDVESPLVKDVSPKPTGMDINMVFMLSAEFRGAMFEKPVESSQHIKLLYIRDYIDGRPISKMFVNGSVVVNLMPYAMFKKLGRQDDKLVKTNLTFNYIGSNLMEARGVISMEFTVGSKSLPTAFFVIEVQGNYSVILGCDWIHANRCIPILCTKS